MCKILKKTWHRRLIQTQPFTPRSVGVLHGSYVRRWIFLLLGFRFSVGDATGDGGVRDEVTSVAEQAVQFVLAYDQLKEDSARSLPDTLTAVERHMKELRTVIYTAPSK